MAMKSFSTNNSKSIIFTATSLFGAFAPTFAVILPNYFYSKQPVGLIYASLICIFGSAINYLYYSRTKNINLSSNIISVLLPVCYIMGVLTSGGYYSGVLVYGPVVMILSGFLSGVTGITVSASLLITLSLALAFFNNFGFIGSVQTELAITDLALIVTSSFVFTGGLTFLFVFLREKSEAHLLKLNENLKKERELLLDKDSVFVEAQKIAKIGSWSVDVKNNKITWSAQMYEMFPADPNKGVPGYEELATMIHPDDLDTWKKNYSLTMQDARPFQRRYRILNRNKITWIETTGQGVTDSEGNVVRLHGTCQDITESVMKDRSFKQVFDNVPVGIVKLNQEAKFVEVNFRFAQMLGYLEEELIGKSMLDITHPEDIALSKEAAGKARSTALKSIKKRYIHKSGQIIWGKVSSLPVFSNENEIIYSLGVIEDITEQRRRDEELKQSQSAIVESELFLRAVLQNVPSMIFVKNFKDNLSFSMMNKAGEDLLGIKEKELLGKNDFDFFPKEQAKFFHQKDLEVFNKGSVVKIDKEEIDTPEGKRILKTYKVPTYDIEGNPKFLVGISNDITDEVKVNEERERVTQAAHIIQSIDQAIAKSDHLGNLIPGVLSSIAHTDNWRVATYWEIVPERDVLNLFSLYSPSPEKYVEFIANKKGRVFKQGEGLPGRVLASQKTAWIPDITKDDNFPGKDFGIKNGLHGGLAFPVFINQRIVGVIEMFREEKLVPASTLDSEFLAVGERIGQAIENLRTKEDLEQERIQVLKSAERFKAMFQSSPNPILVFGKSKILDCNIAAIETLGAENRDQVLDLDLSAISPEYQPDGVLSSEKSIEMVRLALKNGKHQFEWQFKKMNETLFPVDVTVAPIDWEDKESLLVLWNDLTEKKERDLQIIQSSKLASLGEMSAGIAHEINNPLAIISGVSGLLHKYVNDKEKFSEKIGTIQKSCTRISKIVKGLKKFSRSGEKSSIEEHSLCNIVNEAVTLTDSKAKRYDTQVEVEYLEDLKILCNEIEIEQVVVNLINNAIDAVENCDEKWIKISIFSEADSVVLRVVDSGLGIQENIKGSLFDPFFTTKIVGKGTGLGLSISKGILDEHQATIAVINEMKNTCFEIRFKAIQSAIKSA